MDNFIIFFQQEDTLEQLLNLFPSMSGMISVKILQGNKKHFKCNDLLNIILKL